MPQEEAVAAMLEKYEVCCALFDGFDWSHWTTGTSATARLALLPNAQEHILRQEDGKERFVKAVTDLSSAFALAVPHEEAMKIRDDIAFFQAVRAVLAKAASQQQRSEHGPGPCHPADRFEGAWRPRGLSTFSKRRD